LYKQSRLALLVKGLGAGDAIRCGGCCFIFYHLAAMVLPMNWAIFCIHRNGIKYKLLFYVNNI